MATDRRAGEQNYPGPRSHAVGAVVSWSEDDPAGDDGARPWPAPKRQRRRARPSGTASVLNRPISSVWTVITTPPRRMPTREDRPAALSRVAPVRPTRRVPCPQRRGPRARVEGFGAGEVSAVHRSAAQARPVPDLRTTVTARAANAGRHGPVPAAGWLPAADAPASPRAAGPQAVHQAGPRRRSGEVPASRAPRRALARRACPQGRARPGCRYAPGGQSRPARPQ